MLKGLQIEVAAVFDALRPAYVLTTHLQSMYAGAQHRLLAQDWKASVGFQYRVCPIPMKIVNHAKGLA